MNVKCNYSEKFLPLIKFKQKSLSNEDFKNFLIESFEEGNILYETFIGGSELTTSNIPVNIVQEIDSTTDIVEIPQDISIQNLYGERNNDKARMFNDFRNAIVESAIYDKNENEGKGLSIHPEVILDSGISVLNDNIFVYKVDLLNNINNYLNNEIYDADELYLLDYDIIFSIFSNNLLEFEKIIKDTNLEKTKGYKLSFDSYVILSKFDSLLKQETPFVKSIPELESNPNVYRPDRYMYIGPQVQHFTGFSSNKDVDVSRQSSDLFKTLMNYFPEVNEVGKDIRGTTITTNKFISLMTALKTAFLYGNNKELEFYKKQEWGKGAKMDMKTLLEVYIKYLQFNTDKEKIGNSTLINVARGIRKHVFNSDIDPFIKNMMISQMLKSIGVLYGTYEYDSNFGGLRSRNLKDNLTLGQKYQLSRTIQTAIHLMKENNNELLKSKIKKYNIDITDTSIIFNNILTQNGYPFTINWNLESTAYRFSNTNNISDNEIRNLIKEFISYPLTEDFADVTKQLYPNTSKEWTLSESWGPVLGLTVLAASKPEYFQDVNSYGLVNVLKYDHVLNKLAEVSNVVFGGEATRVVKNSEGNNLPMYKLHSVIYQTPDIKARIEEISKKDFTRVNMYKQNIIYSNSNFIGTPIVRSDTKITIKSKNPTDLGVSELMREMIIYDFYQNLESGTIHLQNAPFSDKSIHFLIPYHIKNNIEFDGNYNLYSIINNYLNNPTSNGLNPIKELLHKTRSSKINILKDNILLDYSIVLQQNFSNLYEINNYLSKNKITLNHIQKLFHEKQINFYENIHFDGKAKLTQIPVMNETIEKWIEVFNDKDKLLKRMEFEKINFFKNLINENFNLFIFDDKSIKDISTKFPNWFDNRTKTITFGKVYKNGELQLINKNNINILSQPEIEVQLHPIFESYFWTDVLLSNEYTSLHVGEVYTHPNKNKDGIGTENYYRFSEANRLSAQNKRNVIFGATHHSFLSDVDYGVNSEIKISVLSDDVVEVFNLTGQVENKLDVNDGAGWSSPYQSIYENNSLVDAKVGENKKTILHDIDPIYGRPTLLKWAVFNITNELRRKSRFSNIKLNELFKKMHSDSFNKQINFNNYYNVFLHENGLDAMYFLDPLTNKNYKIISFENSYNNVIRNIQEVSDTGILLDNIISESFNISNIYDIDQLFGGAYSKIFSKKYNNLQYNDSINYLVSKIIEDENLKNHMISYLVNKSAIKVGAGNLNSSDVFRNNESLKYITMSTKFGGVQLDADHDIDVSEVTEMSQMISSLIEGGHTLDLVEKIYNDIGNIVVESTSDYWNSVQVEDKDKLYNVLGKSLIETFLTQDKDTLGLAQSFVTLAERNLADKSLNYKLPFSAGTINGKFVATIASTLNKKGIRRKYFGVGSIQAPSYNVVQYFNIDGNNYSSEQLLDLVKQKGITDDIIDGKIVKGAVEKAMSDVFINGQLNPFIKPVLQNEIDLEDSIIEIDINNQTFSEVIHVDTFEKYDRIKHFGYNNPLYNWTIRPKNLKGMDTKFWINVDNEPMRFSIYDLDTVRLSHYLISKPNYLSDDQFKSLQEKWIPNYNNLSEEVKIKFVNKETQNQLQILSNSKLLPDSNIILNPSEAFMTDDIVMPYDVRVEKGQIVMGKTNASKLGLFPTDNISDIKQQGSEFFYNKLLSKYKITESLPTELYDLTMFTEEGEAIYIKVATSYETNDLFSKYSQISNQVQLKNVDIKGREYFTEDQKQFYYYTDDFGQKHTLLIINDINLIRNLQKNKIIETWKYNFTLSNYEKLYNYIYKNQLKDSKGIYLKSKDKNNNTISKYLNTIPSLEELKINEVITFNERLENTSENRYNAFIKQLNFIGSRIPAQAMQSFMPLEVIMFTESETNELYLPKVVSWLNGSDYK